MVARMTHARWAVVMAVTAIGCARAPVAGPMVPAPEIVVGDVTMPVAIAAARPASENLSALDDSAADLAALEALAILEFRSLDPRAAHVRGPLQAGAVPSDASDEPTRPFAYPRGGVAGSSAPTYDIDVASFADHDRVRYYVNYFRDAGRERFTIWLGRMSRYEGMIRETLRGYGVPEDLVYLALIESGFSANAVSRARAVGMWQFIERTGRSYGLSQDVWVDERRDPFEATDAAARHLRDLNDQFGSWYLAAAAYNGGAGRVSRGIRRLQSRGHDYDDRSDTTFFALSDRRYLRRETRDYVPKLIAAALIAKHPARYGFTDIEWNDPLVFDEVTIADATAMDVIARLADTTERAMLELNPRFYRRVTPPGRAVVVRVPRGRGGQVATRWAVLPERERVSFIDHRIERGETLALIGKRYGVSVSLVLAANPGTEPRRLRIGQRLVIPLSGRAQHDATAGRAPALPPAVESRYHAVRWGESLWVIAQRYGVRTSDLRVWNGIAEDEILRVGTRLRVGSP